MFLSQIQDLASKPVKTSLWGRHLRGISSHLYPPKAQSLPGRAKGEARPRLCLQTRNAGAESPWGGEAIPQREKQSPGGLAWASLPGHSWRGLGPAPGGESGSQILALNLRASATWELVICGSQSQAGCGPQWPCRLSLRSGRTSLETSFLSSCCELNYWVSPNFMFKSWLSVPRKMALFTHGLIGDGI